jgi:hypothetical protein
MRTIRALSSFNAAARSKAGDSCRVFSGSPLSITTPQSPFPALVLPVSGGQERGPGECLSGVAKLLYRRLQRLHASPFFLPRMRFLIPCAAILFIESGCGFRYRTGANVLLDHTTTAPIVVAAPASFLPGHVTNCYESGASDKA